MGQQQQHRHGHRLRPERAKTARRHDDIELAMEEGLMEVIPRLETRTPYIATFANIATLLGLLGTILGLISAFTAVASADPAQKADLLSASISVAMNTTAFGLIAAIPMLLAFAFINSMTGKLVDSMEMAWQFVNVFRQVSAQQERKNDGHCRIFLFSPIWAGSGMRFRRRRSRDTDVELNITAFLNLMVVLIPFLLINVVFAQVSIPC